MPATPSLARDDSPAAFLDRAKRYSLFGLAFDPGEHLIEDVSAPTLDVVASLIAASPRTRFRVVAYELRYSTPEENRQHTAARLQALRAALQMRGVDLARIDFVAAGDQRRGPVLRSALQRALVSRIDLLSGT
jgi:outer membrane protein OmpA-like peptidoglycan-associated protein